MQTSSPIGTPKSAALGISFGGSEAITPLRQRSRPVNKRLTAVLNEEDDERERAERRRSAALQRSISEIPSSASTAPNDSMKALTEDDLKSQLYTISKLYCENRINIKNAWNIRVIDVLRQIVSKGKSDVLKVAGNSLNIAGKVYGLRVDDLHTESLKLASSLARNFASKKQDNNDDDENVEDNNQTTEEAKQKRKQTKKKRMYLPGGKKQTVASDPKEFLGDIPKLESASFSARTDPCLSNTENLFTKSIMMDPAGYKFMLGSEDLVWRWSKGSDPLVKTENNTKYPINIPSLQNSKLCKFFDDFQIDMWDPDKEEKIRSNALDEVVLDDDGIPIPELDGSIPDVFMDRDEADDDDPIIEEAEHDAGFNIQTEVQNIIDFRPTENALANDRTDYSFAPLVNMGHQVIEQIWAGPAHWKLKYIRNSKLIFSGQKGQDEKSKKKANKKKKPEYEPINLRSLVEEEDWSRVPKKKSRIHRVFEREKFLLPIPQMIALKVIEKTDSLMMKENVKLSKKKPNEEVNVDYQVTNYDYKNPNDSLYCPGADDNDNDDGGADHFDNPAGCDSGADLANGFMCDNLIDAPEMVDQNYMHFATRAKKMDMKKLKEAVWCTLTDKIEYDLSAKVIQTSFSKMFDALPHHLNDAMKADLSCHLAFVALLHLCNEQNLQLNQDADITDFEIVGPNN